jgi:hypothetical protein
VRRGLRLDGDVGAHRTESRNAIALVPENPNNGSPEKCRKQQQQPGALLQHRHTVGILTQKILRGALNADHNKLSEQEKKMTITMTTLVNELRKAKFAIRDASDNNY